MVCFNLDDIDMEEKDATSTIASKTIDSPARDNLLSGSPAIEPLSDQEDSLLDDFQEPGIEEIISDEEMPDFPEYEYGEWEEQWTNIFSPSFNPFSESFQVAPLKVCIHL